MLTVTQATQERRSTRAFLARPVPHDLVRDLLDTARCSLSSGSLQSWRLWALSGEDLQRLKQAVVALGYADPAHPINTLRTDRADLPEIAELRGFAS